MHAQALPDSSSPARQPTRPIRALSRGLEVLAELNRRERAPIHTLSSAVRLPRTTTFRILETLRLAGFVERDAHDDCYRPTVHVRSLADGFDDEAMIAHIGKAYLPALATEIVWPMDIATPAGAAMLVRETSRSPSALEPSGTGDTHADAHRPPQGGPIWLLDGGRARGGPGVARAHGLAGGAARPRSAGNRAYLAGEPRSKASACRSARGASPRRSLSRCPCAPASECWAPSRSALPRPPCHFATRLSSFCRRCAKLVAKNRDGIQLGLLGQHLAHAPRNERGDIEQRAGEAESAGRGEIARPPHG